MEEINQAIRALIHQKTVELLRLEAEKKKLELELFSLDCLEGLEEMRKSITYD